MDNVEYFEAIGVLDERSCLAHCIWVNDREVGLIRDRRVKVLHCPSSNLKLGSGIAKIPEFLSRGISVSLGADGAPCNNTLDMFEEMRLAALIQKPAHGAGEVTAEQVLTMATTSGAAALGCERELGSIESGKKADLVLLDLDKVWNCYDEMSGENIYSTIVYSCSPANVHSVMVDGRWLLRDYELRVLDEERSLRSAQTEVRKLLQRVRS
jgi:cytosine/adenosine deaminase-related metal-dependent hydrolase